jgi:hypothetical protein
MANELAVRYARRGNDTIAAFVVDTADVAMVDAFLYWYMTGAGYVYAMRGTKFVWLTAILLAKRPGFVIDHVNRYPPDNRRENLRYVTQADNAANTIVRRHSKSRVKGVRFHRRSGLWQARIAVRGKTVGLGYYHELVEAAAVFLVAHRYYHPALYPGFDVWTKSIGLDREPWRNRGVRRTRTTGGRYAVERRPDAE